MALIFRGLSECAVCGKIIERDDDVAGLPHFATGPDDPHWRFTDAPFHLGCYLNMPEREAIEARLNSPHFANPS